jgi:hypothetical protein
MAGLDPAIHPFRSMDARVKPAHDQSHRSALPSTSINSAIFFL